MRATFLFIVCVFSLVFCCQLEAQDPVFSQYFAAPLQTNPAFTGITQAPRVAVNYRHQYPNWPNAYATFAATYEHPIQKLNSGLGLSLQTDSQGDGLYKVFQMSGVYGYTVRVNKYSGFKFGVEVGLRQTTLDWNRFVFGQDIDPIDGPNANGAANTETQPENLTKIEPDISAGVLYYTPDFYVGLSVKHLNTPNESIIGTNEYLLNGRAPRIVAHMGTQWHWDGKGRRGIDKYVAPHLMFVKQGQLGQIHGGAVVNMNNIFSGISYRHTFSNPDALVILLGVRYNTLKFGYSYDITVSELATAPGGTGGTHELSLSLNLEKSNIFKQKKQSKRYNDCFQLFN